MNHPVRVCLCLFSVLCSLVAASACGRSKPVSGATGDSQVAVPKQVDGTPPVVDGTPPVVGGTPPLVDGTPRVSETAATAFPAWEQLSITRESGPRLHVYASRGAGRLPVVVYVPGSRCWPLFMTRVKDGKTRLLSTFMGGFLDTIEARDLPVHFVAVERRGLVSFVEPPATETPPRCTDTLGAIAKEDRVADVRDVVVALASEPWVGPVYLAGHSEGGDVVAGVVRELGTPAIAGIGLFAGAGPTRFFEYLMLERDDPGTVAAVFADMLWLTGPGASGDYRGAPIKRDLSYAIDSTPLEDLHAAALPIFVAQGTNDDKTSVEAVDLFVLELLRRRDRVLRYERFAGLDHGFQTAAGDDRSGRVLTDFVRWMLAPDPRRSVEVIPE